MLESQVPYGLRAMHPIRKLLLILLVAVMVCVMLYAMGKGWAWAYELSPTFTVCASVVAIMVTIVAYLCVPRTEG